MTEQIGIIHPPPDLRGIVDSTAKYVAKNGATFEERIMREHRGKPKFSFLFPNDPFNAYYKHKVKEIKNSLLENIESKVTHDSSNQSTKRQQTTSDTNAEDEESRDNIDTGRVQHSPDNKDRNGFDRERQGGQNLNEASRESNDEQEEKSPSPGSPRVKPKLNEYIQQMTMKLEEPQTLNYLASPGTSLTRMDCDVIKLTAQFIAVHGRSFLLELASREQDNAQFDFLKPQHGQFSYMTNLMMQYALIQNSPLDILDQLEKDATSQKHVLDRIRMRAEWNRMLEIEKRKNEEAEEKERLLYSQIDWHDFVVVEMVDYDLDEKGEYPPTTPDQVGTRLLMQQRYEERTAPEEMDIDMDVDSDDQNDQTSDEFAIPDPPDLSKVLIRKDYDPKAATKVVAPADNYFVSPITNERIPIDKIHEHVRYNLADPRYLEKKDQMFKEKMTEETVFASGSQIQDSLKNLAERRTDIFGMNDKETAIGRRIGEEEEEPAKDDRLIWDGHKSSLKKKKLN